MDRGDIRGIRAVSAERQDGRPVQQNQVRACELRVIRPAWQPGNVREQHIDNGAADNAESWTRHERRIRFKEITASILFIWIGTN
jgi:hypothetical protein